MNGKEALPPSNWRDVGNETVPAVTGFDDLDESDMKSVTVNRTSSGNKSVRFSDETADIGLVADFYPR